MARRAVITLLALVAALATGTAQAQASKLWNGDGPWGPYGYGIQPVLSVPPPPPGPLGTLDGGDFDGDGVPNVDDNCLLVPNPGQEPATKPAGQPDIGPADMLRYAREWKSAHPSARFRTDAELGQACSGYNDNYLRTTRALIKAPDAVKLDAYRFLGESGPMLGGSPDPLSSDPSRGPGNLVTSLPMCSSVKKMSELLSWIAAGFKHPNRPIPDAEWGDDPKYGGNLFDCGHGAITRSLENGAMSTAFWAGKRTYTDAEGGRITNRFVPMATEFPGFERTVAAGGVFSKLVSRLAPNLHPDWRNAQSFEGLIFRGRSYIDGRDTILMDWRGRRAYPANFVIPGMGGFLIYDECRAIQTGVYDCTADVDMVAGDQRMLWQEGYMPWVVKGPPSISQYLSATR